MLPICVWGGWGCVTGWVSKSDHPPEGIWLTFSSPQTPVWDTGSVAAGLSKNLAVVTTCAEVLGTPYRAALMPTNVSTFLHFSNELQFNSAWFTLECAYCKFVCRGDIQCQVMILNLYIKKYLNLYEHALPPIFSLSPWPLVNLFWLTRQRGPGVCSHRDLGRNVRLPPHL